MPNTRWRPPLWTGPSLCGIASGGPERMKAEMPGAGAHALHSLCFLTLRC